MPYPLIILEQHFLSSARNFIADNAKSLQTLGFKKLLLEMDKTMSPKQLKEQLNMILSMPDFKESPHYCSTVALLKMLVALEVHGIECEFIDPETQQEGLQQISNIYDEMQSGNNEDKALQHRDKTTKLRDVKMTPIIIEQAKKYNGGVIYLGGYCHHNLVQLLESDKKDYYRFAIFSNSKELFKIKDITHEEEYQTFSGFSNLVNRLKYYKTYMHHFDMNTAPTFELIESTCGLTEKSKCKQPTISNILSEKLSQSFEFTFDQHSVVNAAVKLRPEQVSKQHALLQQSFPKLSFFMKNVGDEVVLTIPGINLSEQQKTICKQ